LSNTGQTTEGFLAAAYTNTAGEFSYIVNNKTNTEIARKILRVSDPDPNDRKDLMPIKFPQQISIYALARFNYDLSGARAALMNDYDTLQTEMSSNLYDQGVINSWNGDPKGQSCQILNQLRDTLIRTKLTSISGSGSAAAENIDAAAAMQDENTNYQVRLQGQCNPNSLSPQCYKLATQTETLFPLSRKYDEMNTKLFSKEADLNKNIKTVNQASTLLGCSGTTVDPKFDALGVAVDTSELVSKLKQLSPYYISPDAIKFVIQSVISGDAVNTALESTSDRLVNITKILQNMKSNLVG
jgi:hypothetical protein